MQIATVGNYPITIGWLIALLVLIIAILGLLGTFAMTGQVIAGLIAALAVARLT